MAVTVIVVTTVIAATAAAADVYFQTTSGVSLGEVVHKSLMSLSPTTIVQTGVESLTSTISDIWIWLLHNLLTPIILIVTLFLFFYAQYWLIRIYIFTGKYVIGIIQSLAYKVAQTKQMKEILDHFDLPLFEGNKGKDTSRTK